MCVCMYVSTSMDELHEGKRKQLLGAGSLHPPRVPGIELKVAGMVASSQIHRPIC